MSTSRFVNRKEAESILPDGDWIHVFIEDGDKKGEMWHREKVLALVDQGAVELSGKELRSINHGLCVLNGDKIIAIENRKHK